MVKIILIRHGESIANSKGIYQGQTYNTGLTSLGKKQATALTENFEGFKIDKIITSPLLRTRQTAEIINSKLCIPIEVNEMIIEISHGEWEGQNKDWVLHNYPTLLRLWKEQPVTVQMPKGENLHEVNYRVGLFLNEMINMYENKTILIVSHDLIIRVIIALILNLDLKNIWRFRLDNAGVTILEAEVHKYGRVIVMNQCNHLDSCRSKVDIQAL